MKRCAVCKEEKPLDQYYRDRSRHNGVAGPCIPCFKARNAKWRAENPDKVAAKSKRDNARKRLRDPAKRKEYNARYNNTEKARSARAAWKEKYCKSDIFRASQQRSSQRNRWPRWISETYGITVEEYAWMLHGQDFKCPICLRELSKEVLSAKHQAGKARASVDHCHATGRVRGIVCGWCNHKILGPLEKGGTQAVLRAMDYLGWVRTLQVEPDLASAERNAAAARRAIEVLT